MDTDSLSKLLGLCGSAVVALGAAWLLLRQERRPRLPPALRAGYPAPDFAQRDLVDSAALQSLCQSQARLLAFYEQLPASSAARPGLLVFLGELRALMNDAYELARSEKASGGGIRLSRLAAEAHAAAQAMLERLQRDLQESTDGDLGSELESRLEVMRVLARDMDDF